LRDFATSLLLAINMVREGMCEVRKIHTFVRNIILLEANFE
jgi:hypothetical protein